MRVMRMVRLGQSLGLFVHVGTEGEGADDEHREALALARLLGGLLDPVGVDGAVLGTDGDGGAQGLAGGVGVLADGLDVGAGVGLDALEDEALVLEGVLDAGLAQVVEDDGHEVGGVAGRRGSAGRPLRAAPVAPRQHPMRREALDRERPGHADARRVLVGLVVEQLGVGVAADGGVDLGSRDMPSRMSGLLAIDFSVMCGTRL